MRDNRADSLNCSSSFASQDLGGFPAQSGRAGCLSTSSVRTCASAGKTSEVSTDNGGSHRAAAVSALSVECSIGFQIVEHQHVDLSNTFEISVVGEECVAARVEGYGQLERIGQQQIVASAQFGGFIGNSLINNDK
jgi:hypothetical protein